MGSNSMQNGLNFGKKTYWQNDGVVVTGNSGRSGKYHPSSKAAKQPPRCQVEGCSVDLSGSKSYYFRHKVCGIHSKSPMVIVAGLEQRFCQQCSRFHKLPEFDEGKRSCRRRLAGHNERRRKPPSSSLSSQIGLHTSPFNEDSGGIRLRSFLMDFTCPCPSTKNPDSSVAPSLLSAQFLLGNSLAENQLPLRPPITTATTSVSSNNGDGGALITLSDISSTSGSKFARSNELDLGELQRKRQCIELEDVVKSLGLN